jgi:c-di-AMP phosphodiesterase-like protein
MEMEEQQGGLAAVVEEVHEVENPDATFLVFHLKKEQGTLIIARSQKQSLAVNRILERFDGGGHTLAASAYLKRSDSRAVYRELVLLLAPGWCRPSRRRTS